jgi:hypothetical protein
MCRTGAARAAIVFAVLVLIFLVAWSVYEALKAFAIGLVLLMTLPFLPALSYP